DHAFVDLPTTTLGKEQAFRFHGPHRRRLDVYLYHQSPAAIDTRARVTDTHTRGLRLVCSSCWSCVYGRRSFRQHSGEHPCHPRSFRSRKTLRRCVNRYHLWLDCSSCPGLLRGYGLESPGPTL